MGAVGYGQPRSGKQLSRKNNPAFADQADDNPMQPQNTPPPSPQASPLQSAVLGQTPPPSTMGTMGAVGEAIRKPTGGWAGPANQGPLKFEVPSNLQASATPAPQVPQASQTRYNTKLMEGDPTKLNDLNHAAKSPKYDFLQAVKDGKYNYDQLGNVLADLQKGPNARLWQGWTANGKDKLMFNGDPSQLAPEWNGARSVDAIGAFGDFANGGQAAGWRWGVGDDAPGPGGPGGMHPALASAIAPGAQSSYLPQGLEAGTDYSKLTLQQILSYLQGQQ